MFLSKPQPRPKVERPYSKPFEVPSWDVYTVPGHEPEWVRRARENRMPAKALSI